MKKKKKKKKKKKDKIKYMKKSYINKISDKSDITKQNNTKAHKKKKNYLIIFKG